MAQTGKQSPLGNNVNGSFLDNKGLCINPVAQGYMGVSHVNEKYTFGSLVNDSCLYWLTYAIFDAYNQGPVSGITVTPTNYNNLINIGAGVCEALGNAKPPTYKIEDPRAPTLPNPSQGFSQRWTGVATTGYAVPNPFDREAPSQFFQYVTRSTNTYRGQSATWIPYRYDTVKQPNHSITQWGFIRCWALQAWNEFYWNGQPMQDDGPVEYKEFTSSFLQVDQYIAQQNIGVNSLKNSQTFQKGTYSNMNDLTTAGITDVSLATQAFGQDCIAAGKTIDLSKIDRFGLPSVLLQTIRKCNAFTQSLSLALISSGLTPMDVDQLASGAIVTPSKEQEQKIYGAFLVIKGEDLTNTLIPLNCKTKGLDSLADLLNVKKLFPNSYQSLTVPLYNAKPGPTNSKTYYPIFQGTSVSSRLTSPAVVKQVGSVVPVGDPPIVPPPAAPITDQGLKIVEKEIGGLPKIARDIDRQLVGGSATGIGSAS